MTQSADTRQHGVSETLSERGARYGDFTDHAIIAQNMQDVMRRTQGWGILTPVKKQALTVIADKIARILNGDPDHRDNWHDIQGYAKLAEDRCSIAPSTAEPELPLSDPLRDAIANPKIVIDPKPGDRFTVDIDGKMYSGTFPDAPYYIAIDDADTVHPDLPAADMCLVRSGEPYSDDTECNWCGHGPCKSGANDPRIPRVTCPVTDTECGQLCNSGECRRDRNAR